MAEPEFLYAQAMRSRNQTLYAAGGLEGLEQVAQAIVSGLAQMASSDPFHYIYFLFQKPRTDVTFQSLALAQTQDGTLSLTSFCKRVKTLPDMLLLVEQMARKCIAPLALPERRNNRAATARTMTPLWLR
jgi:hypothetical protein